MMITIESFFKLAYSFENVSEQAHFDKISFKSMKKIFVTLDIKNQRACVKLSEIDQSAFSSMNKISVYPVPNKWGKQGWTFIELKMISEEMLKDMLCLSYNEAVAKK